MKYRSKLVLACLVLLSMTLAAAAFSFWSAGQFHRHNERSRFAHLVLEGHLQLKARTYKLFKQFADAMMGGSFDDSFDGAPLRQTLQQDLAALRDLIANEMALVEGQEWLDEKRELQALALLEQQILDVVREFEAARALLEAGQRDEAGVMLRGTLERSIDEDFSRLVRQLIEEEKQEVVAIDDAAAAMTTKVRWLALALAVAAIIATGTFLAVLMAHLQQPLKALVDGMARLSVGNFEQRIAVTGRDEFAQLANGLNVMADQLQRHALQANAARDDLERVVLRRTKELQDANRALQGADNARRRLFADISHELRTPLTVIRGEAEIALRGREKSIEDYQTSLQRIVDQANHTARLVDDLLFIARTDAGEPRLEMQAVALVELVQQVYNDAQALAASKNISVALDLGIDKVIITADPERLRQGLMIVIDNAIRYSLPHEQISVGLHPHVQGVSIQIIDSGIGIAPEEVEQVFERYYRGNGAEHQHGAGSGLGLPIAKAIIVAHGGDISLDSTPGRHTRVSIVLPVSRRLQVVG
jgi:signal transduction histidine kinase